MYHLGYILLTSLLCKIKWQVNLMPPRGTYTSLSQAGRRHFDRHFCSRQRLPLEVMKRYHQATLLNLIFRSNFTTAVPSCLGRPLVTTAIKYRHSSALDHRSTSQAAVLVAPSGVLVPLACLFHLCRFSFEIKHLAASSFLLWAAAGPICIFQERIPVLVHGFTALGSWRLT